MASLEFPYSTWLSPRTLYTERLRGVSLTPEGVSSTEDSSEGLYLVGEEGFEPPTGMRIYSPGRYQLRCYSPDAFAFRPR